MNQNNKTLSIFTIVAVFAMGLAVYSYQNASATIISNSQDPARDAISDAQNVLKSLNTNDERTRAAIAEGQEGLDNATSALDNATSALSNLPGQSSASPLSQSPSPSGSQSTDPLGQNSGLVNKGTNSIEDSPSQPTNFQ